MQVYLERYGESRSASTVRDGVQMAVVVEECMKNPG